MGYSEEVPWQGKCNIKKVILKLSIFYTDLTESR